MPPGNGKTLIRGGFGKVYQYQQLAVLQTLLQRTVLAPTFAYDTTQVASPAITGTFPVGPNANATACLNPVAGPTAGIAIISPACRAFLNSQRNLVAAGPVVNNTTTGPLVDGDRRMAYTWAFSAGVKRELTPTMAASIDYVGNRGKDNTAVIDINEGPINPATGRVTRLGVDVFDPTGELVPPEARGATFVQFNQNQTTELGSGAGHHLRLARGRTREAAIEPLVRAASATRCRIATTSASIIVDSDPRLDYGRCDRDNVHAFATSAYVDIGKGFGGGIVFRAYSGLPDQRDGGHRRQRRRHQQRSADEGRERHRAASVRHSRARSCRPWIRRGVAVRNGIDGEKQVLLDGRFQYIARIGKYQAGLFLEVYNLLNTANFGNPTGARNSVNFMKTIVAGNGRTAQLGIRVTF